MTQTLTPRLALPLLAAGQAQKEVTHNEALLQIDLVGQCVVESADLAVPPAAPATGQCWIVAGAATGDWAGMDGALAGWTESGWRFVQPAAGWRAWVSDRAHMMRFDGSAWDDDPVRGDGFYVAGKRVLAARQAAIADPSGGSTTDVEARAAIVSILAAMRGHGLIDP